MLVAEELVDSLSAPTAFSQSANHQALASAAIAGCKDLRNIRAEGIFSFVRRLGIAAHVGLNAERIHHRAARMQETHCKQNQVALDFELAVRDFFESSAAGDLDLSSTPDARL